MKDITITTKRIQIELKWLLLSLVLAFVLNVFSIIKYDTSWLELITSLHLVLLMSLILYVLLLFFRGLASLIMKLGSGRKK